MPIKRYNENGQPTAQKAQRWDGRKWADQKVQRWDEQKWVNVSEPPTPPVITYIWEEWELVTTTQGSGYQKKESGNPGYPEEVDTRSWSFYENCDVNSNTGEISLSGSINISAGNSGSGYGRDEYGSVYHYFVSYDPTMGGHNDVTKISVWAEATSFSYSYSRGGSNYLKEVTSSDPTEYPYPSGPKGNYWYENRRII